LDEIQAAVLRVKLRYLDQWNNRRAEVASIYSDRLKNLPIKLPSAPSGVKHAWHLYVVLIHDRDAARDELLKDGIETGIHYPTPVYLQDAYRTTFGNFRSENAEFVSRNCLSLPIGPHLNEAEVHRVCDALINFVEKPRRTNR
jgi:dTDP-4-amino-4,6-dideoxygalactose transaminase